MLSSAQATNTKTQIFQNIIENEAKTDKRKGEGDEVTSVNTSIRELKTNVTISKDKRATKASHPVPLKNYATGQISYDTLHASEEADQSMPCSDRYCKGSFIDSNIKAAKIDLEELLTKAEVYLKQFYLNKNRSEEFAARWEAVEKSILETGTYDLTFEELEYGVQLAWRNEPRCTARIQWGNLHLCDKRDVTGTDEMFEAICEHIKSSYNDGAIRPTITVFRKRQDGLPDFRVWNQLMIGFAGYSIEASKKDGQPHFPGDENTTAKIGDQANLSFTKFCQRLGWEGGKTNWDHLPLVLSVDGEPKCYKLPEGLIPNVEITHPSLPEIDSLGLKWFPLPGVSCLLAEIGGLQFPAAPFTGWYGSIEILRDLLEENRYPGVMQKLADVMNLDSSNNMTLWRDRVALELNIAILHSFAKAGVAIVDQHSSSEQFMIHMNNELRSRGGCPADWVWLNPSQSGSLCPVYHQEMLHYHLTPCYKRQDKLWEWYRFPEDKCAGKIRAKAVFIFIQYLIRVYRDILKKRPVVQIFYATETGTAKRYAEKLRRMFSTSFNVVLLDMSEYKNYITKIENKVEEKEDIDKLRGQLKGLCFFVTSTFGNGTHPTSAGSMAEWLDSKLNDSEETVNERLNTVIQTQMSTEGETEVSRINWVIEESVSASDESIRKEGKVPPLVSRKSTLKLGKLPSRKSSIEQGKKVLGKTLSRRISMNTINPVSSEFSQLRYGVFALGNTSYPHYCGFGKWLDSTLGKLSNGRLTKIGLGDELGDRDADFRRWSQAAYRQACIEANIDLGYEPNKSPQPNKIITKLVPVPDSKITDKLNPSEKLRNDLRKQHRQQVVSGKLSERRVLCNQENHRIILVRLEVDKLENETPIAYAPGDHVAVYPHHTDSEVNFVMEHLTKKPSDLQKELVLREYNQNEGWIKAETDLPASNLFNLLKYHVCMRSSISKEMLQFLGDNASDSIEAANLKRLATNRREYNMWKTDHLGIVDLFQKFPSIMVDASGFVYRLKPIQPRYYSIASSLDYTSSVHNNMDSSKTLVDLILTVLEYKTGGLHGIERKGFCSNHLADANVGESIMLYFKESTFHLPPNLLHQTVRRPILMIGAGSGIAPFRGFWQQVVFDSYEESKRNVLFDQIRKINLGTQPIDVPFETIPESSGTTCMTMFFGCRDQESNLLETETEMFPSIIKRFNAFSRQQNLPKQYVSDAMKNEHHLIYDALVEKNGLIYVCGKITMADTVFKTLVSIIAEQLVEQQLVASNESANVTAEDFINSLIDDGRYHQDIFGTEDV